MNFLYKVYHVKAIRKFDRNLLMLIKQENRGNYLEQKMLPNQKLKLLHVKQIIPNQI